MDRHEYFRQCIEVAKDAIKNAEEYGTEVSDNVHGSVDIHEYVIYTNKNLEVLTHSNNADAYFEENDTIEADNFADLTRRLAAYAMRADVNDCMDLAKRELQKVG